MCSVQCFAHTGDNVFWRHPGQMIGVGSEIAAAVHSLDRPAHAIRVAHVAEENRADGLGEQKASSITRKRTARGFRFVVGSVVGLVSFIEGMKPFKTPN